MSGLSVETIKRTEESQNDASNYNRWTFRKDSDGLRGKGVNRIKTTPAACGEAQTETVF